MRKINTSDRILETIQNNVVEAITKLQTPDYLDIETRVIPSADNLVPHSLGKKYKFFYIVSKDAEVDVWLSNTINNAKHQEIILKASATANITLRVF